MDRAIIDFMSKNYCIVIICDNEATQKIIASKLENPLKNKMILTVPKEMEK